MFNNLKIRYQTARSLPAPYAYFYTLTAKPVDTDVKIDLAITYPDRDDIDDDELMAEGFTHDDDFSWSGRLPGAWLRALGDVAGKTRLQTLDEEKLGEDDDFWEITLDGGSGAGEAGKPANADDWQYVVQELIQATYEADKRERPFELTFLNTDSRGPGRELVLTASFADRTVIVRERSGRDGSRTLPWASLQRVMSAVYSVDFDADTTLDRRPKTTGQWLNLGTDDWHDISSFRDLVKMLSNL